MITSAVLLINLREFEESVSQYINVVIIFMIVFVVLGVLLLLIGVYLAIKEVVSPKQMDIDEEFVTPSPQAKGLRIIRPSSSQETAEVAVKKDEKIVRQKTVEEAPKEVVKEKKPVKVEKKTVKQDVEGLTDFTYEDGLQSIVDRYNTEKVKKAFKGWYNTLTMTFPDVSKTFIFKINGDEGIELTEGIDNDAVVQVKMDSTIFIKMMTKQINPIKAYSSGGLEVKGEMKNMLKLRKLMF